MRAFVRILCVLLAVAIAAAGVLTVIEIIAAVTDNDPVIVKWHGFVGDLASNEWKTAGPRVAAIVLIIVGLLLLFFGLRRGKPANVALTTSASDVDMTTTRRSLQRALAASAADLDGITDAKAKVKGRKVVVRAQAAGGITRDDARSRLTQQLQQRLDTISLAERKRLKVKVIATPDKGTPPPPAGLSSGSGQQNEGSLGDTSPQTATAGVGAGGGSSSSSSSSAASNTGGNA